MLKASVGAFRHRIKNMTSNSSSYIIKGRMKQERQRDRRDRGTGRRREKERDLDVQ